MKIRILQIGIFTFSLTLAKLNSHQNLPLVHQAETLFSEGLYQDALPLYEEMKESKETLDAELADFLTIRIAECQLELKNYQQVLSALKNPLPKQAIERDYLLASAHRYLREYEQALLLLKPYQKDPRQDICLELGLNYFYLNQLTQADYYFNNLILDSKNPSPYFIAQLYLSRISLIYKEKERSQSYLDNLNQLLPQNHLLRFEMAYLQGLTFALAKKDEEALISFEQALPKKNELECPWYQDTLYQLASSCLRVVNDPSLKKERLINLFSKIENTLQKLLMHYQDERIFLALAEAYLLKANRLADKTAYQTAQQLLIQAEPFFSEKGKSQALIIKAAAAPTYAEREELYQVLTSEVNQAHAYYAQSWYRRGINAFEEGLNLKEKHATQANELFKQAALFFEQSFRLLETIDISQAALSIKYQALSYYYQNTSAAIQKAWELLNQLIDQRSDLMTKLQEPEEIFYLAALIATPLISQTAPVPFLNQIEALLKKGIETAPNSRWVDQIIKVLGIVYFKEQKFEKADQLFTQFIQDYPYSLQKNEALFWLAKCAEMRKDRQTMQAYLQQIFMQDPESSYAAPAYFSYYTYREYLHGHHKALKHLQAMSHHFPSHPLLITAYYLIGLNYKKDRLYEENKVPRHKNLTAAINAFQEAELLFDSLYAKELIPTSDLAYFLQVRDRCTLERALTNLAIAEESQSSKRHIYLSYAEDVFKQMRHTFQLKDSAIKKNLTNGSSYPLLLEEAEFWLAQTYIRKDELKKADLLLTEMLEYYQQIGRNKGYICSRVWYEKGILTKDPLLALKCFVQAENAAQGLNPDQKLDIWIQESLCYKKLQQLDEAIRVLSKVINDETISGLRIKAMFLRAEMYELQGRPELALKQLETTSKKGGEWGKKAKEKLEKEYGYQ